MRLRDEQVIVFQHRPQATLVPPKERKERLLRMYDQGFTSLNVNQPTIKQRFEDFAEICGEVAAKRGEQDTASTLCSR